MIVHAVRLTNDYDGDDRQLGKIYFKEEDAEKEVKRLKALDCLENYSIDITKMYVY